MPGSMSPFGVPEAFGVSDDGDEPVGAPPGRGSSVMVTVSGPTSVRVIATSFGMNLGAAALAMCLPGSAGI